MEGLTMSLDAVSMACKELREWGLATAIQEPGERKTYRKVETDLATVVRNITQARKRREWDPILEGVRDWIPRVESDGSTVTQVFRNRLASIEACVGMADGMVTRFLDGGMLSDLGLKTLTSVARTDKRRRTT